MKALSKITLVNGDVIDSPRNIDVVTAMWAQMHKSAPGSIFRLEQINARGQIKQIAVLAGTILRVDER